MTKKNPTIIGAGHISATVIEHSLHPSQVGKPLITLQLRYPRFIHAEAKTHRVIKNDSEEMVILTPDYSFMDASDLSRNASSSRAIPVAKMLEQVRKEPAMPVHWGKNQPGMQASVELSDEMDEKLGTSERQYVKNLWIQAAQQAADIAERMQQLGAHKQVANRILEPFQFISVIVTATEWQNFFELRDHPDAQPEIKELARVMKEAIQASKPRTLNYGEWHLPYVTEEERRYYSVESCRKMSAARCARVSYLTHEGKEPDVGKDFALFDALVGSVPLHASPIEHQATPDPFDPITEFSNRALWGNFSTWVQFRKIWERNFQDTAITPTNQE